MPWRSIAQRSQARARTAAALLLSLLAGCAHGTFDEAHLPLSASSRDSSSSASGRSAQSSHQSGSARSGSHSKSGSSSDSVAGEIIGGVAGAIFGAIFSSLLEAPHNPRGTKPGYGLYTAQFAARADAETFEALLPDPCVIGQARLATISESAKQANIALTITRGADAALPLCELIELPLPSGEPGYAVLFGVFHDPSREKLDDDEQ